MSGSMEEHGLVAVSLLSANACACSADRRRNSSSTHCKREEFQLSGGLGLSASRPVQCEAQEGNIDRLIEPALLLK